jgi:DNA mismatch endonuclease (patch repair protein)
MTDVFSKEKRSEVMSKIRGKDTRIEIMLRKAIWKEGFRYRKNVSGQFGKPDMMFKRYRTVVFVDSCFWHGCKKHFKQPATRVDFWKLKIERNKKRDKEVNLFYRRSGWKVIRIWEHELKKNPIRTIQKLLNVLKNGKC